MYLYYQIASRSVQSTIPNFDWQIFMMNALIITTVCKWTEFETTKNYFYMNGMGLGSMKKCQKKLSRKKTMCTLNGDGIF